MAMRLWAFREDPQYASSSVYTSKVLPRSPQIGAADPFEL
jgi:hypothetical protein